MSCLGPGARQLAAVVCGVALHCAVAGAQDKPDFSGRWVLNDLSHLSTDTAAVMTVRMMVRRTNVRGEAMMPHFSEMIVEREVETGLRIGSYQIGLVGGVVGGIDAGGKASPSSTEYSTTWQGDRLVIMHGTYSGPPGERGKYSESTEEWSLESADRLVITLTTRASEAPTTTRTIAYRRQPLR